MPGMVWCPLKSLGRWIERYLDRQIIKLYTRIRVKKYIDRQINSFMDSQIDSQIDNKMNMAGMVWSGGYKVDKSMPSFLIFLYQKI